MPSNAEELTSNLQSLLAIHSKAIEVLKAAKKKSNKEIGNIVGISHTTVSTILNRAKGYGYVDKKDGKWVKTKEIKGIDLYRMAKAKFKNSLNPAKGFSKKGTRVNNPLKPLIMYKEATEMMEMYRYIFCLENTLREFLRGIFKAEKDWIDKRISESIKNDIKRAKNEPYYAHKRKKDDLEFVTLGHLFQIIIDKSNWNDISPKLKEKNKNKFITTFEKILPSRNATAHCVALGKQDRELIGGRIKEVTLMFDFD